MSLEDVAEELYSLDAAEFVAVRDARAREARQDGDRALAEEVKRLKRPSAAAWVVNVLVRQRAEEVERLVQFGSSFRQAQADLAGDELRRLGRQRHQVVGALGQQARAIAGERGQQVTEATLREVESTLDAAMADEAAADAVRSGRLLRSLKHAGMGPVDLGGAVAVPAMAMPYRAGTAARGGRAAAGPTKRAEGGPGAARPADAEKRIAAAREALEDAEADVERADHRLTTAGQVVDGAEARRTDREQRARALEDELARTHEVLDGAKTEVARARKERETARKTLDAARAKADRARARLEHLEKTGLHVVRESSRAPTRRRPS